MGGAAGNVPGKDFVVGLCEEAGRIMLESFGRVHEVAHKGQVDLVTEVDLALEEMIGEAIMRRFPEHSVFSEERWQEADARQAEYIWLVDPLDGTTNYVHGYPMFCVSVGLVQGEDVLLGCVYDPLHEELFYAEKNRGATVNGRGISVSSASSLISSLLSTGFPYERASGAENNVPQLGKLINRIQGVRRSGSLALDLAYVAAGRLDGHWELSVKPWDTAAGGLLVKEAGGCITNVRGEDWSPFDKDVAASNGKIHGELLAVLHQHE